MVRILVCAIVLGLPTIVFGQPRVATPTFSVGGGEYTTVIMVVVRVSTPGATIRFTQNGSDPTEFDPVIVSGSRIAINTSQTLKARAWKTGSRPSAVRAETYQMVSAPALWLGVPVGTIAGMVVIHRRFAADAYIIGLAFVPIVGTLLSFAAFQVYWSVLGDVL